MTWLVRVFLGIDAVAALVIVYFFFVGLADGSVSSFNIALWIGMLAAPLAIIVGGAVLNANGRRGAAVALLLVLAIPAMLFGLFVLAMIVLQPNWR